jgi:hypothetical protein
MNIAVNEIIETVCWYSKRYPQHKQELLDHVLYCSSLTNSEEIELQQKILEDTCQRICNPSDYTIDESDPIDWSAFV